MKPRLCIQCGKDIGIRNKLFCNKQCRHDYTYIQIPCSYCGKLREYRIKELVWKIKHGTISGKYFFCKNQCQGKWIGENFGFKAHPENRNKVTEKKWDYLKVYLLRDETGWRKARIGRALSIPASTISSILRKRPLTLKCSKCGGKLFKHEDGLGCISCGKIVYSVKQSVARECLI